jgi:hypothetical protein
MKYRVIKKRMHQLTGSHNSYSKTRKLLKRIRMGHTHPWYMASDLKFNMRFANFPITTNDTLWTAYLRLKRVHHRQIKYRAIRNVKMEDILQAEYGTN